MAKKKAKPMTLWERNERKAFNAKMRELGIMPPRKKPLNRKAFIVETQKDWTENIHLPTDYFYLDIAIGFLIDEQHPTAESVGAAKLLKIACEMKKMLRETDKPTTLGEAYAAAKAIIDL